MFILMISEYACISFFKDYHQSANKFLNFWKRVSIPYLLKNTGLKLFLNGMPQSFLPLRGSSVVKNLPANAGDQGSILVWDNPLEMGMATHSSIPT